MIGFMPPQAMLTGQHRNGGIQDPYYRPAEYEYIGKHRKPENMPAVISARHGLTETPFGFIPVRSDDK
jgi:hypothetical protein